MFDIDIVMFARDASDPAYARQVGTWLLGVRVRPFGTPLYGRGVDLSDLEVGVGIGVAHELRIRYGDVLSVEQGAWGRRWACRPRQVAQR